MLVHFCLLRHCRLEVERSGTGRRQWRCRGFRGRRSVAKAAVRAHRVVVPPPGLNQYSGFAKAVDNLAVEQLVAQRPIEALVVAILPGRCRDDVKRLHADLSQPFLNRSRDKFWATVGPDVGRRPARDKQLRQGCFCGTFSPSRRQMRSTRFRFTVHPASRSSAVTRR